MLDKCDSSSFWSMVEAVGGQCRLDHQPLFGKGACAPPPKEGREGKGRGPDTREWRKSSLGSVESLVFEVSTLSKVMKVRGVGAGWVSVACVLALGA